MKERLLIVDNDLEMLQLMSILVRENTPYIPVATNNPLEALDIINKGNIDLIIANMKLPVIDGIKFLERIMEMDRNKPVIIVAEYGTVEHGLEVLKKGGFDYITKPFRKEQMLFSIEKALTLAKIRRENKSLRNLCRSLNNGELKEDMLFAQ